MNHSFFPPWKAIETTDGFSEEISRFFMGGYVKEEIKEGGEKRGEKEKPKNHTISIAQVNKTKEMEMEMETNKTINIDSRFWAFWTTWISFYGLEEYNKIPEHKRLSVWIEEKTKMSDWFQVNFLAAKKEMGKRWHKMTNMDMEDIITGLVTDVDEKESGLKTMLLCWTYYSMTMEGKGAMECIWVVPEKCIYYSFTHGLDDAASSDVMAIHISGVFMEILEPNIRKNNKNSGGASVSNTPPKKQRRFEYRELEKGEVEMIRNSMVEITAVNRCLGAVSKYSLKELMEMGTKMGLSPPMISVVDEKGAMKLDLAEKVRSAEMELGVVRKPDEKKVLKKELEKVEKWKKGDWYERMEAFCMEAL